MKSNVFLLLLFSMVATISVSGQKEGKKYSLTGTVRDNAGVPVSGAMILIDKQNTNVVTDNKGLYKVKVKPDAQKITVFTFSGKTGDAMINGRKVIDFTIEVSGIVERNSDVPHGEESVNIGYGKVKRKDSTLPVNKVTPTENDYSSYSNIYEMIKGKVPGVQVTGKRITIQGTGTTNTNDQPLFVVDGVVVGSIDDIHPALVKSIEVLKGPSASIYGSRGGNGVILITLKGTGGNK